MLFDTAEKVAMKKKIAELEKKLKESQESVKFQIDINDIMKSDLDSERIRCNGLRESFLKVSDENERLKIELAERTQTKLAYEALRVVISSLTGKPLNKEILLNSINEL